jgi:drug/metabolite transporter (DMT)-like permease
MKLNKLGFVFFYIIRIGPPLIAFFIGVIYVGIVLVNFNKDTTPITNAAFVIVSVLSGLSFAMASAVTDKKVKDRFVYCGERFFHSAILLILASVLKYAALVIDDSAFF